MKRRIVLKATCPDNEQYRAYKSIRDRWDFDDKTISHLLQTHTVTEILEGSMTPSGFVPKECFYVGKDTMK